MSRLRQGVEESLTERIVLVKFDCWRKRDISFGWVHGAER